MRYLIFPLFLSLTACATPQERCVSKANQDLRVVNALISTTQGNLSRGFALREVQQMVVRPTTCTGVTETGAKFSFRCEKTKTINRTEPVAIDLTAERAKLASLQDRQQLLLSQQAQVVAQCRAQFPQ